MFSHHNYSSCSLNFDCTCWVAKSQKGGKRRKGKKLKSKKRGKGSKSNMTAEFRDNVFTFDDNAGMSGMSQRIQDADDGEILVEAEFSIGDDMSCSFGIEGNRMDDGTMTMEPLIWVECKGGMGDGMVDSMLSVLDTMEPMADEMCGEMYKQCPPNFMFGMMEYTMMHMYEMGTLPTNMRQTVTISNVMPVERIPEDNDKNRQLRRGLIDTCSDDPVLGNLANEAFPRPGDANCPEYTSTATEGNGATCMCPYSGGNKRYTYYDDSNGTSFRWSREYGSDNYDCSGRCGAGCNSADNEGKSETVQFMDASTNFC